MATFLDLGLMGHFGVIFPILLVFVIVFAIQEKTQLFGENKGLHAIVALSLAMMMLFVPGVVRVIALMAPWFILIMLFLIFVMVLFLAFGMPWETIVEYVSKDFDTPHWVLLVVMIIILVGALGSVYGTSMLPYTGGKVITNATPGGLEMGQTTDTGDFNQNVGRVIFHPKVLGLILVLVIGSLSVKMLTKATRG